MWTQLLNTHYDNVFGYYIRHCIVLHCIRVDWAYGPTPGYSKYIVIKGEINRSYDSYGSYAATKDITG